MTKSSIQPPSALSPGEMGIAPFNDLPASGRFSEGQQVDCRDVPLGMGYCFGCSYDPTDVYTKSGIKRPRRLDRNFLILLILLD
jgi:hypothetical protein